MSVGSALALLLALAALAALPSASVMLVVARSAALGRSHGAAVAAGIVAADLLFILVAVFGLALLLEWLGPWFVLVHVLAAGWLVWLGVSLWRSAAGSVDGAAVRGGESRVGSLVAGFTLTLADQKAVLFYLAFLPAFLDLERLTASDLALLAVITVLAVGGVKLAYALLAERAARRLGAAGSRHLARVAAGVMLLAAGVVLYRGLA